MTSFGERINLSVALWLYELHMGGRSARTESGSGCSSRFARAFGELEFVTLHVDTAATEADAFGLQAEALFQAGFAAEFDLPTRAEDAVPGESDRAAQDADDLACRAGMSGSAGDGAVG